MSSLWEIGGYIAAAGGIGGVVAALLSEDEGFVLPTRMTNAEDGTGPRLVGLILIGAIMDV